MEAKLHLFIWGEGENFENMMSCVCVLGWVWFCLFLNLVGFFKVMYKLKSVKCVSVKRGKQPNKITENIKDI